MTPASHSDVPLVEVNTTAKIRAIAAPSPVAGTPEDAVADMAVEETPIVEDEVQLPDYDGNGISTLIEVVTVLSSAEPGAVKVNLSAAIEVAKDETKSVSEAQVQKAFVGLATGLQQKTQADLKAAGVAAPSVAPLKIEVDLTPPETGVTAAVGPIPLATGGSVGVTDKVTLAFTCTESPCTYRCAADGAPFAACASPVGLTAAVGKHIYDVKAADRLGNVDPTPAQFTWTVDGDTPDTLLTDAPPGLSASAAATFKFSSDDPQATFVCQLDGASVTGCVSPFSFAGLSDGDHTLVVFAKDAAGNADPTPVSKTWTVDTTSPPTPNAGLFHVAMNPPGSSDQLSASQGAVQGGAVVKVYKDSVLSTAVGQSQASGDGSVAAFSIGDNQAGPSDQIFVVAYDAAGNASAPVTLANDVAPPPVPLLSVSDMTSGSATLTNSPLVSVLVYQDSAAVVWCLSEQMTSAPATTDPCFQTVRPTSYTLSAGDAARTLYIWVKDAAGNVNAEKNSATITLDTSPPARPSLTLKDQTSGAASHSNSRWVTVTITSEAATAGWLLSQTYDSPPPEFEPAWKTTKPTTFQLTDQDGLKTVYLWVKDAAGNPNSTPVVSASITLDSVPPSAPSVAVSDRSSASTIYTNDRLVDLAIDDDGTAAKWLVSETQVAQPAEWYSTWTSSKPTSFYLLGVNQGTHTVYAWAKDSAGNVSASAGIVSIILDTIPPANPTLALTDKSSASETHTNDVNVDVAITGDGTASNWILSETHSTAPGEFDAAWSDSAPSVLALTSGDGTKTAYAWLMDEAGNVNTGPAVSVDIVLDTIPPEPPVVTLADETSSNPSYTNSTVVTAAIEDDATASDWILSETQSTQPSELDETWTNPVPTSATLSTGDGAKTVYVWAKDLAGNVSAEPAGSYAITLDTIPPGTPTLTLTDQTSGSPDFTNDVLVDASILDDESPVLWNLSETQSTEPGEFDAAWVGVKPTTFTLTSGDGEKVVYVWLQDIAGNINVGPGVSAGTTLDTIPPADPTLVLSDPSSANTSYTNDPLVDAAIGDDATPSYWLLSESHSTQPTELDESWAAGKPTTFTLSGGDAIKTVYAWLKDAAGNVNSGPAVSAAIELDTTPPADPTLTLTDQTSSSAAYTNDPLVDASIVDDGTVSYWILSETQSSQPTESDGAWTTPKPTTLALLGGDGPKTAYVWLKDAAGNVNAGPVSTPITLDTVAPGGPTLALADPTPQTFGYSNTNPVDASIVDDGTVSYWLLSETQSSQPTESDGSWTTPKPTSFTLTVGDGTKTVYLWVKDAAGNVNAPPVAFDSIICDTTFPAQPNPSSVTVTQNAPGALDSVQGTAGAVEANASVKVWADALLGTLIVSGGAAGDGSFSALNIADNVYATVWVTQTDLAGNQSLATSKTNDIAPPAVVDNMIGDDTWRNADPSAIYDVDFSDLGGSNLDYVQYTVWTGVGKTGSEVITWSTIASGIGAGSYTTDWSVNFSALGEGTNYVSNIAYDYAGNSVELDDNFYIKKDTVAPTTGSVNDGTGPDLMYQTSTTTMDANWMGFDDATSGLASYDYNLSTTTGCAGDVITTVNVGLVTTRNTGSLTLLDGSIYYNCVRAVDAAGNPSVFVPSSGVTVDTTPPYSSVTLPADGAKVLALPSIMGACADSGSGVQQVEISIQRLSDSKYWTGATFNPGVTWLLASGTLSWNYTNVPSWADAEAYNIQSKGTDQIGNIETPSPGSTFTFDVSPPTFGGVEWVGAAGLSINLGWSAATDVVSSPSAIVYDICQTTTPGGCSAFIPTYTTSPGATSYTVSSGLTKNVAYYFVVRARDEAGNMDSNGIEKGDVAGGNVWAAKTAMPTARLGLAAAAVNGRIYVIGGANGTELAVNEEYDPVANTWATKTAMTTARNNLAASAVNGRIYAIGGYNLGYLAVNEEYDPVANTWATKTAMTTARHSLAAVAVNGRICAIGGWNGSGSLAVNEEYDPVANAWSAKADMTTGRNNLAAAAVNGRIYAIGGYNLGYLATNEEYDPVANTWSTKADMATARNSLAAAAVNGRVYVIGGANGSALATNEEYDPVANAWSAKADMPTAREWEAAATVNGRIYAIGGDNGSVLATNEEFIPPAVGVPVDAWEAKTGMPTGRRLLAAAAVNGRIYAIGGEAGGGGLNANEEYDSVANSWAVKAGTPTLRQWASAAAAGGRIYVFGGYGPVGTTEEYDPITDLWATKTAMSLARQGTGAAEVNGKIYVIGGHDGSSYSPAVEEYNPVNDSWAGKTAMPAARQLLTVAVLDGKVFAIGGEGAACPGSALGTVQVYDPVVDGWASKASLSTARRGLQSAAVNGRIYAFGGDDCSIALTSVEEYDPGADSWTTLGAMPTDINHGAAAESNGRIYGVGGCCYATTNLAYAPPLP
ncbi:MAG: hypothetical protein HYY13_05330 [Nitrospirae bacterium]|nr:hypothetical protein [Nitrospirota bacterium]